MENPVVNLFSSVNANSKTVQAKQNLVKPVRKGLSFRSVNELNIGEKKKETGDKNDEKGKLQIPKVSEKQKKALSPLSKSPHSKHLSDSTADVFIKPKVPSKRSLKYSEPDYLIIGYDEEKAFMNPDEKLLEKELVAKMFPPTPEKVIKLNKPKFVNIVMSPLSTFDIYEDEYERKAIKMPELPSLISSDDEN